MWCRTFSPALAVLIRLSISSRDIWVHHNTRSRGRCDLEAEAYGAISSLSWNAMAHGSRTNSSICAGTLSVSVWVYFSFIDLGHHDILHQLPQTLNIFQSCCQSDFARMCADVDGSTWWTIWYLLQIRSSFPVCMLNLGSYPSHWQTCSIFRCSNLHDMDKAED